MALYIGQFEKGVTARVQVSSVPSADSLPAGKSYGEAVTPSTAQVSIVAVRPTGTTTLVATTSASTGGTFCYYTTQFTTVGECEALFSWYHKGMQYTTRAHFNVVDPTGGSSGTNGVRRLIACREYQRPEVRHFVYQTLNGDLVARQNAQ